MSTSCGVEHTTGGIWRCRGRFGDARVDLTAATLVVQSVDLAPFGIHKSSHDGQPQQQHQLVASPPPLLEPLVGSPQKSLLQLQAYNSYANGCRRNYCSSTGSFYRWGLRSVWCWGAAAFQPKAGSPKQPLLISLSLSLCFSGPSLSLASLQDSTQPTQPV